MPRNQISNMNPQTLIHFGVIDQSAVLQAWADSSYSIYDESGDINHWSSDEPLAYVYVNEGYLAKQDAQSPYIMVLDSPYITYANYCSPCYPNAGNLDSPAFGGISTYCFGHDWFDAERAPYPVYDSKTGRRVEPEPYQANRPAQTFYYIEWLHYDYLNQEENARDILAQVPYQMDFNQVTRLSYAYDIAELLAKRMFGSNLETRVIASQLYPVYYADRVSGQTISIK